MDVVPAKRSAGTANSVVSCRRHVGPTEKTFKNDIQGDKDADAHDHQKQSHRHVNTSPVDQHADLESDVRGQESE
jgi:hypothetical protein